MPRGRRSQHGRDLLVEVLLVAAIGQQRPQRHREFRLRPQHPGIAGEHALAGAAACPHSPARRSRRKRRRRPAGRSPACATRPSLRRRRWCPAITCDIAPAWSMKLSCTAEGRIASRTSADQAGDHGRARIHIARQFGLGVRRQRQGPASPAATSPRQTGSSALRTASASALHVHARSAAPTSRQCGQKHSDSSVRACAGRWIR